MTVKRTKQFEVFFVIIAQVANTRYYRLGGCQYGYPQQAGLHVNTKQLIDEAVSLPVEERALVVDSLLKSFHQTHPEIDAQWLVVAQRRLAEIRDGKVKPVPGKEVFARMWNSRGK